MHYLCNENKGADQLRGYRQADLLLCFRICRLLVFSRGGSLVSDLANFNDWEIMFDPTMCYRDRSATIIHMFYPKQIL